MKTITEAQYLYLKAKKNAATLKNRTKEISDEEYEDLIQYSDKTITPINNNDNPGTEDPDNPEPEEPQDDHDYSQDYLTFEALEDGTFSFTNNDLYYSTNNGTSWKSLAAGTETELISKGAKVLWKRDSNIINKGKNGGIGTFSSTNKFNISGNILSLLINTFKNGDVLGNGSRTSNDNTTEFNNYALYKLFSNCKNLISAENLILPNKTLYGADWTPGMYSALYYCIFIYSDMFEECTNLILPPKILPATVLSKSCYSGMFKNCVSLIKAPILPAQNSGYGDYCYQDMFMGCTSLKYIKCLANNFSNQELLNWVKNVSETGTFIKNKDAVWDIGINGIPAGWEVIDEEVNEE